MSTWHALQIFIFSFPTFFKFKVLLFPRFPAIAVLHFYLFLKCTLEADVAGGGGGGAPLSLILTIVSILLVHGGDSCACYFTWCFFFFHSLSLSVSYSFFTQSFTFASRFLLFVCSWLYEFGICVKMCEKVLRLKNKLK